MVIDLAVLLGAIILLILGAKGTYKGVWNGIFPSTPITSGATPIVVPGGGGGAGGEFGGPGPANSFASVAAGTNPPTATAAIKAPSVGQPGGSKVQ